MINHLAIILDGNRRYAKKRGKLPWEGHAAGAKTLQDLLGWSRELGLKELTLYCFSTENFKRTKKEVDKLMELFLKFFKKLNRNKDFLEKGIKLNFVGKLSLLPNDVRDAAKDLMRQTKNNTKLIVNFAIAYGSRMEIIEAVKKILKDNIEPSQLTEEKFNDYLYLKSEPDLLIRPGGEKRLSNFILWQLAYSELYFLDKLWPEFTKEDLKKAIDEVENRHRRFGK